MEIYNVLLTIACALAVVFAYLLFNSMKLNDKYEDALLDLQDVLLKAKDSIDQAYLQMKDSDIRGAFEADDEIGVVFNSIKDAVSDLEKSMQKLFDDYENGRKEKTK